MIAKGKYEYWLTSDGITLLEGWARDGLTDEQIAHNMGIAYSTLRVWRDKYSAISAALKKGKEVVDYEVENAFLKKAKGYEYQEITKEPLYNMINGEPILDEDGKPLIRTTKIVTKMVAPDTAAAFIWLKNRKSDKWKDSPVDTGDGEKVTIVDDL